MREKIRHSLVIVTWNAKQHACECLTSLCKLMELGSSEIIVVDNSSTDGTPEFIRERFPSIKLIRNASNLGFAKGTNIGIKEASGDYVSLINSDVIVPAGCIESMYRYMEQNKNIGMLGPRMLGVDGQVNRSTMVFPTVWNTFCHAIALDSLFKRSKWFGGFLMKELNSQKTTDVDVLNGWFWMVRRRALDQVGLLDERFFIYGEDIDWCRRFHQSGWRVVLFQEASAVHYGGASSKRAPIRFYLEMQRANLQYWEKHYGWLATWGFLMNSWLHHCCRIIGYGAVCVFDRNRREEGRYKIERSIASIRWLVGGEIQSLKER